MAIFTLGQAVVKATLTGSNSSAVTITAATAGQLIYVAIACSRAANTDPAFALPTDNIGGTWHQIGTEQQGTVNEWISRFYKEAVGGETTITNTWTNTTQNSVIQLVATWNGFKGAPMPIPLNSTSQAGVSSNSGSNSSLNPPTVTPFLSISSMATHSVTSAWSGILDYGVSSSVNYSNASSDTANSQALVTGWAEVDSVGGDPIDNTVAGWSWTTSSAWVMTIDNFYDAGGFARPPLKPATRSTVVMPKRAEPKLLYHVTAAAVVLNPMRPTVRQGPLPVIRVARKQLLQPKVVDYFASKPAVRQQPLPPVRQSRVSRQPSLPRIVIYPWQPAVRQRVLPPVQVGRKQLVKATTVAPVAYTPPKRKGDSQPIATKRGPKQLITNALFVPFRHRVDAQGVIVRRGRQQVITPVTAQPVAWMPARRRVDAQPVVPKRNPRQLITTQGLSFIPFRRRVDAQPTVPKRGRQPLITTQGLSFIPFRRRVDAQPVVPKRNPRQLITTQGLSFIPFRRRVDAQPVVIKKGSTKQTAVTFNFPPSKLVVRKTLIAFAVRSTIRTPFMPPPPPILTGIGIPRKQAIQIAVKRSRVIQVPYVHVTPITVAGYEIIFVDGHPALHVAGLWYTMIG